MRNGGRASGQRTAVAAAPRTSSCLRRTVSTPACQRAGIRTLSSFLPGMQSTSSFQIRSCLHEASTFAELPLFFLDYLYEQIVKLLTDQQLEYCKRDTVRTFLFLFPCRIQGFEMLLQVHFSFRSQHFCEPNVFKKLYLILS
jgi:hypothetical protein